MKWSEVKWSEVKWSEVKWSEVKWSEVKVTIECLQSQSKPRKMKRQRTIAIRSKQIRQLTSDSRSLPKFDVIFFQERSETFMKKTVVNLISIFNMNCTEFASVFYRTFSKVMLNLVYKPTLTLGNRKAWISSKDK